MTLRPWYNKDANYQTNAKSFMDYLARTNKFLEVLIEDYEIFQELVIEELERIKFDSEMAVDDILVNWLEDGTLARIINDGVLGNKADTDWVDNQLNQLKEEIQNDIDEQTDEINQFREDIQNDLEDFQNNLNNTVTERFDQTMKLIYPSGTSEDTTMLNDVLSSGGRFLIKKGIYKIDGNVELVSNTYVEFEQGAEFHKIAQESDHYRIIDIDTCDNVELVNPVIIGERDDHTGEGGEWGYGLHIINSDNIVIKQAIVKDTWGDGIYVGHDYFGENTKRTGNIYIINPYIDNVRRNGISVCGGENIVIDNPLITNVNGTDPQAGIDIEPESEPRIAGTGVLPFLTNLTINNPITKYCKGSGITVLLDNLADRGLTTDININNHVDVGSQHGFRINRLTGKLGGSIKNKSPHYRNNQWAGIFFHGYKSTDTPTIEIENPTIENFNRGNHTDPYYYPAIAVIILPSDKYTYNVGNLIVTNPIFRNNLVIDRIRLYYVYSGKYAEGQYIENVKILSPVEVVNGKEVTSIASNAIHSMINDPYNLIKDTNTNVSPKNIGENRFFVYSNKSATDLIEHNLMSGVGIGNKVTFLVENSRQFIVNPPASKAILPLGTVNQTLVSSTIGSRLVVTELEDGNFGIVEMIGEWSAV